MLYLPTPGLLAPSPAANARRVVLVDDDAQHLLVWENVLRRAGYEVAAFRSAAQALPAIAQGCDCVVTDYNMPGMNGVELIRLSRRNGRPRFIVLTGSAVEGICEAAQAAGASHVFLKPAPPQAVLRCIAELCER